jgi:hypothetical protein
LEVYVILYYLGGPAMALSAISIGALSVFIKGGTFFIPGSLGARQRQPAALKPSATQTSRASPSRCCGGSELVWTGWLLSGSRRRAASGRSGQRSTREEF